jgi:hypothetical protein
LRDQRRRGGNDARADGEGEKATTAGGFHGLPPCCDSAVLAQAGRVPFGVVAWSRAEAVDGEAVEGIAQPDVLVEAPLRSQQAESVSMSRSGTAALKIREDKTISPRRERNSELGRVTGLCTTDERRSGVSDRHGVSYRTRGLENLHRRHNSFSEVSKLQNHGPLSQFR